MLCTHSGDFLRFLERVWKCREDAACSTVRSWVGDQVVAHERYLAQLRVVAAGYYLAPRVRDALATLEGVQRDAERTIRTT